MNLNPATWSVGESYRVKYQSVFWEFTVISINRAKAIITLFWLPMHGHSSRTQDHSYHEFLPGGALYTELMAAYEQPEVPALTRAPQVKCTCDMHTVLLRIGCQCGAMKQERRGA